MSYKIIVDSCCDLTPAQFLQGPFIRVPLTISLAGEEIMMIPLTKTIFFS